MRVALAAVALAAASVAAPAQAVYITLDPYVQSSLIEHDGYDRVCPTGGGAPIQQCITTPTFGGGVLEAFGAEIGQLDGTHSFSISGGSSLSAMLIGTVVFANGVLLSSSIDSSTYDHHYGPQSLFYESYSHGVYANVAVRLADGTVLLPVPEAGTWTMMIAGFAAIGLALRRLRQGVVRDPEGGCAT